ncbi:MAG TPA: hypothetical protein VF049_01425 [Nocardioidaceae bacterium]
MSTRTQTTAPGIRRSWADAHAAVAGTPRWARVAAYAVPLTVLPSSAWRIAACTFHAPILDGGLDAGDTPSGLPGVPIELYVVLLSIASEMLAFTAVGLVAGWGETFPRWVPRLRGRRVPLLLAVVPGGLGAVMLTLLTTWVAVTYALGLRIDGGAAPGWLLSFDTWQGTLAVVAYAPLLMWGPLLGAVTFAYWRRRGGS